jgi:hypothetical protein
MQSQNKDEEAKKKFGDNLLLRYAGMAFQFLVVIGITVYAGYKADQWLALSFPVFVWLLPLIVITGLIIKVVRDTSKK